MVCCHSPSSSSCCGSRVGRHPGGEQSPSAKVHGGQAGQVGSGLAVTCPLPSWAGTASSAAAACPWPRRTSSISISRRRWNSMTVGLRDQVPHHQPPLMSCGRTDRHLSLSFLLRVRWGEEDDHLTATQPNLGVFTMHSKAKSTDSGGGKGKCSVYCRPSEGSKQLKRLELPQWFSGKRF